MYKIMLVEDEPEVLRAMTTTLRWEELHFHPPKACVDGRQALACLDEGFVPDAVITDINMPFVDGITLTQTISERCPHTIVVMLTGYDDFQYAHQAIKLKVFDYILKPVTPRLMTKLIGRLRDELDSRSVRCMDTIDLVARERFLCDLLSKRLDATLLENSLHVLKIPLEGSRFLAMAIDIEQSNPVTVEQARDNDLMRYGLSNICEELCEPYPEVFTCITSRGPTGVIICAQDELTLYQTASKLSQLIADTAKSSIRRMITCGVGMPVDTLDKLYQSYQQAEQTLHYRFFYGAKPYLCYKDVSIDSKSAFHYASFEDKFRKAVRAARSQQAHDAVSAMFAALRAQKISYARCIQYSQKLVICLIDCIGQYLDSKELELLEKSTDKTTLPDVSTLPQIEQQVHALCNAAFRQFDEANAAGVTLQVRRAEAFIREHYSDEELSLQTITEKFSVSISYFSAVFKAQTGATFVEYLTQLRIEKAQYALTYTDKRSGDIAQSVGFSDPHYFSVTFKRLTGMTPKEYRQHSRTAEAQV